MTRKIKHIPLTTCCTIDHKNQRYDTAGDYIPNDGHWFVAVSKMENPDYEFMVLVHELIELYLTQKRGIEERKITAFDLLNKEHNDPGTLKSAPYHKEHMFCTKIEKMLCKELGISWKKYDKSFEGLKWRK